MLRWGLKVCFLTGSARAVSLRTTIGVARISTMLLLQEEKNRGMKRGRAQREDSLLTPWLSPCLLSRRALSMKFLAPFSPHFFTWALFSLAPQTLL